MNERFLTEARPAQRQLCHWSPPQPDWEIMETASLELTVWPAAHLVGLRVSFRQFRWLFFPPPMVWFFFSAPIFWERDLINLGSFRNLLWLLSCLLPESCECSPMVLEEMFQLRENCSKTEACHFWTKALHYVIIILLTIKYHLYNGQIIKYLCNFGMLRMRLCTLR